MGTPGQLHLSNSDASVAKSVEKKVKNIAPRLICAGIPALVLGLLLALTFSPVTTVGAMGVGLGCAGGVMILTAWRFRKARVLRKVNAGDVVRPIPLLYRGLLGVFLTLGVTASYTGFALTQGRTEGIAPSKSGPVPAIFLLGIGGFLTIWALLNMAREWRCPSITFSLGEVVVKPPLGVEVKHPLNEVSRVRFEDVGESGLFWINKGAMFVIESPAGAIAVPTNTYGLAPSSLSILIGGLE